MAEEEDVDMESFFAEVNAIPTESETETISADPQPSEAAAAPAVPVAAVEPAAPPPPPQAQTETQAPSQAAPKVAAHHLPISFSSKVSTSSSASSSSSSSSSSSGAGISQHVPYARPGAGGGFATGFTTTYVTKTAPVPPPPPPLEVKARQAAPAVRTGAGDVWVDPTLAEWPDNDYRIFVGDLSKECRDEQLGGMFSQYKSFARARVVRSAFDQKGKGYGFVSFLDPMDCAKAIREMNGKYCGPRPMKITKSTWEDRNLKEVKKKAAKKRKVEEALGIA